MAGEGRDKVWQEVRAAAECGNWSDIQGVFYTINPINRQLLFEMAFRQLSWDPLLALLQQGFGTGRLQEVVRAALDHEAWDFIEDIVRDRPSLFCFNHLPLLREILLNALDRQMWPFLSAIGPGISPEIDAMIFDRAVAMVLDSSLSTTTEALSESQSSAIITDISNDPSRHASNLNEERPEDIVGEYTYTRISRSASRWWFIFNNYFGNRWTQMLKKTEKFRSQRHLDEARRRRAFEEATHEFFRTDDDHIETILISHFAECPSDLQVAFFVVALKRGKYCTAYELIGKLSECRPTGLTTSAVDEAARKLEARERQWRDLVQTTLEEEAMELEAARECCVGGEVDDVSIEEEEMDIVDRVICMEMYQEAKQGRLRYSSRPVPF